ncbi:hypothetical protein KC19_5G105900 [Ceratodon purpureus]|uniref:Protein kinase domain-containing protein n=2 Tax=Ceratodon purpureus TaxID=3225 RepID=A0A8T0I001_CERPU|nr:hypothetical protein KC19_5G105900 [Ceratodon purpureus]KAG0576762.1 hypothetical protein KC19_5G105900 [Ceratodon purpureus]
MKVSISSPIIILLLFTIFVVVITFLAFCRRRIKSSLKTILPLHRTTDHETSTESLKLLDAINFGPRRFCYAELRLATDDFNEERLLGRGGFGSVYKGVILESTNEIEEKTTVAIKRMAKNSRQGEREFHAEVLSTGRIRHRNLVSLLGWCHERDELLLVYEFMAKGSLDQHLYHKSGYPTLPWPSRFQILKGIASALDYLHGGLDNCILHRDIKPSNVLLDSHMTARLGDFGLARLADHTFVSEQNPNPKISKGSHVGGTLGYMAPELCLYGKLTKKVDVYSFGMVALEVVCGQRPPGFHSEDDDDDLVEMVWKAYQKEQLLEVIDPCLLVLSEMISSEMQQEVTSVLQLGLLCTLLDPSLRPPTNRLLQGLNGDFSISLPASRFRAYNFSYADIQAATEDFSRVMARGSYGNVYKGVMNNQDVAVKRVSPNSRGEESHGEILNMVTRSRHRNLVSLLGWCYENGELLLVYEFMDNGCLDHHLHHPTGSTIGDPLPWTFRFKILQGVAEALDYLHSGCQETCILHQGVNPSNIMLDKHMTAKLADLGLNRIAGQETLETEVEYSHYIAPELRFSREDSAGSVKSDVYGFGMLALEVVCARPPLVAVQGEENLVQWVWSMHERGQLLEVVDPSLGSAFFETTEGSFDFHEVKRRQQITRVLQLGMSCTLPDASLRPHSNRLIQALYGDWSVSLPILPPSYAGLSVSYLPSSTSFEAHSSRD